MQTVTTTELVIQRTRSSSTLMSSTPNSCFHASNVNGSGIRRSGSAMASASVLNEVAIVIRNGPMKMTAKSVRIA